MFVFKAAVVGEGAAADEIARAIEAAEIGVQQLATVPEPSPIGDVEFVIATGLDDVEAAQELFAELDAATPSHAVLAADTASMPISDVAELTERADKVIGFHFAGPATKVRAVEVIEGEYTSPETVRDAVAFAAALKKAAVRCVESPGAVIARIKTAADEVPADTATMRRLVESCRVLEEGVAAMKEIDGGLVAAGVKPPPFAGTDETGLDDALARLELLAAAEDEHGELFEPPVTLRRLVAQGRLGRASGQGFYAYPRPDAGWTEAPIKLESRGEVAIAWLDRPPANSISPDVVEALSKLWTLVSASDVRALVIASANPNLFCAGADIKAFASMDAGAARRLASSMHALLREFERSSIITIAAVNGIALGGGCELAMACDLRVAADSASFGQPEIDLGLIPGFGGTQRLPRLVGTAKALEMNLSGLPIGADEAYELGLANRLVPDHELLDAALNLARGLAHKAPGAVQRIKQVSGAGDLDAGIEAEIDAFAAALVSDDGREGVAAFVEKRTPNFFKR
jgi:enoyl-CoA hydratase/carnithine racemase